MALLLGSPVTSCHTLCPHGDPLCSLTHLVEQQHDALVGVGGTDIPLDVGAAARERVTCIQNLKDDRVIVRVNDTICPIPYRPASITWFRYFVIPYTAIPYVSQAPSTWMTTSESSTTRLNSL